MLHSDRRSRVHARGALIEFRVKRRIRHPPRRIPPRLQHELHLIEPIICSTHQFAVSDHGLPLQDRLTQLSHHLVQQIFPDRRGSVCHHASAFSNHGNDPCKCECHHRYASHAACRHSWQHLLPPVRRYPLLTAQTTIAGRSTPPIPILTASSTATPPHKQPRTHGQARRF
jgi:hypothetical protein